MVEYVGLDVSKEETAYCVKGSDGKVLASGKVATDLDSLFGVLKEHCVCPERIVLETGTQSNWLARELGERGLPVECLDARRAHAVLRLRHNKTDANDAEALAELARLGFFRAVAIKSEAAQADRVLVQARAQLVSGRRSQENALRGLLASMGLGFAKGVDKFAEAGAEPGGGSSRVGVRGGDDAVGPRGADGEYRGARQRSGAPGASGNRPANC